MSVDEVKELAAKSSPFQREILAKGFVTDEDFFKAVTAERQCAIDSLPGFEAEPITIGQDGAPGYGATYQSSVAPTVTGTEAPIDSTMNDAVAKCKNEYSRGVATVWAEQKVPSAEEKEELRPKLIACLQTADVQGLKKDSTDKQIADAIGPVVNQAPTAASDGGTPTVAPPESPQVTNVNKCLDTYPDFFRVSARKN